MSSNFKSLVKNTVLLGGARFVELITSLVKVKLSAVILGVTGLGVFNQLNFLSENLSAFTLLRIGDGLTKQIAESVDKEGLRLTLLVALKSYICLLLLFLIISVGVVTFFAQEVTVYVFGESKYFNYFLIALCTLPLLVVNSIPLSVMRGFGDMSTIARSRVIVALLNICHVVPLIYFYELDGAAFSVFLSYLVQMIVNIYLLKKLYFSEFDIKLVDILRASIVKKYFRELLSFSIFGLTIGLYLVVSEFICRGIVVSNLGVKAIGLYSPNLMIAALFTGFLVPALTTYLYSKLCNSKNNSEISDLLNDGMRLATFALMPLLFFAIPYKTLAVSILYTSEFFESLAYLPFHLLGVIFQVWFNVLSQSMSSTGRIKQHGYFRFFYLSLDIAVTYYFVINWGMIGWLLKHIVSPFVFYFIYMIYIKRNMQFSLKVRNLAAMIYLLSASMVLIIVERYVTIGEILNYGLGPVLFVSGIFLLDKTEKEMLRNKFVLVLKKLGVNN